MDEILEQEIRDDAVGISNSLYYEGVISTPEDATEAYQLIYNYLYTKYEEKSSII